MPSVDVEIEIKIETETELPSKNLKKGKQQEKQLPRAKLLQKLYRNYIIYLYPLYKLVTLLATNTNLG